MATLQSVGRKILTYISPSAKEQSAYFEITRDISEAQFYLETDFRKFIYGKRSQIATWTFLE